MKKKYMIDASVWIEFFRDKNFALTSLVKDLMEKDVVYINGIVQTELLKGAKSEKNYRSLRNNFNGLHFLEIDRELFDSISDAAYKLRKKGITVPLADLIIAVQCVENHLTLIENDKHFELIKQHLDLNLHRMP
ncbi:MAG: PIN domain-containing protein [Candidatus Aminicenantes bacterium]|nr:PIN domain-containing protein [Candidatus Aminicenantes bacterium]